jgi:hypothetical protein
MYTGRSYQCIYRGIYTMKLAGLLETENSKKIMNSNEQANKILIP